MRAERDFPKTISRRQMIKKRFQNRREFAGGLVLCALLMLAAFLVVGLLPRSALADSLPEPLFLPPVNQEDPLLDRRMFKEPYRGDLDGLIRHRIIRVLVTYSPTGFFLEDGRPRGFEYELMEQYQKHLKSRVRSRSWPVVFAFIPMRFDELLPALAAGWGDIAAAGLTVTPERQALVDFTEPYLDGVKEIVVTAKGVEGINGLDDLSGRQVYVNLATSYAQHLRQLNRRFLAEGRAPIDIQPADARLLTEDILELVNAGIVKITIADDHLARLWSEAMPNITLREDLAVSEGGQIAWAVRKDSPELRESLNRAIATNREGTLIGNVLLNRYFEDPGWVTNPLDGPPIEKLADLQPLFRKYGQAYGFDWITLAALAYQESKLDQASVSPAGAIGIMQIKPATAKAPPVSIEDIKDPENNIHAGTRYLAYLRDEVFDDPEIAMADRLDFVLAAYNAGPGKIRKLRRLAAQRGYDPNRWFFNVESIGRRRLGRETVEYVANVNKYMIAYKLSQKAMDDRIEARSSAEETVSQ